MTTQLTEEDLDVMSEILGIRKERLLAMTEAEFREAELNTEAKIATILRSENAKLHSETIKLCFQNLVLYPFACATLQVRNGFLRTLIDVELFLRKFNL